jgi:lysozyme family protein
MSSFELAWPTVLRHEGGYCNNSNDAGGPTKYGISLRWLKGQGLLGDVNHDMVVDIRDIQALTVEDAGGFYRSKWWDKYGFGRVLDQTIATKLFDTAVNVGTPRAVRFAQEAAFALGAITATVDGQLGPQSVAAINAQQGSPLLLLHRMQDLQATYYRQLAESNPRLAEFLTGWLARAYDRI